MQEKIADIEKKMKSEVAKIRGKGPSRHLVNDIGIDYYGTYTLVEHISSVTVSGDRILIEPYDKSTLRLIEKAVSDSKLKLSANNDGVRIIIPVPLLTTERKKELAREIRAIEEKYHIALRDIRHKEIDIVLNDDSLSEDEVQFERQRINDLTGDAMVRIKKIREDKINDLTDD